jgi:hypothetical protein
LDVGVKNDDQLVKLAAIIQRIISKQNDDAAAGANGFSITDDERKQLMEEVEKLQSANPKSTSISVKDIK